MTNGSEQLGGGCCPNVGWFMPESWRSLVGVFMFVAGLVAFGSVAAAGDYVLGPQDKLKIRVYEWRPVTGSTFEWAPLNGEFVISAGGTISLPIIGSVPASGLTTDNVAEAIGERLQAQTGLQKRPVASVEVSEFRPFFATGLVAKPGKYNYLPGLTVIEAVSIAGGVLGPVDANMLSLQRDALVNRGDIRTLEAERFGLLARQSRLDAIIQGRPTISFPADLMSRVGQGAIDRMMREEQALFEARQRSIDSQVEALRQAKALASNEIQTLNAKMVSLTRQVDLATKDLGAVSKLATEGLTLSSRQLGAAENVAELEGRKLDASMAILRAQQDIVKSDSDAANLSNRYRVEALTEAADIRAKLANNLERTETARALLDNIETRAPNATVTADSKNALIISIVRVSNGAAQTIAVGDNDIILPGDVIRVERMSSAGTGVAETGEVGTVR